MKGGTDLIHARLWLDSPLLIGFHLYSAFLITRHCYYILHGSTLCFGFLPLFVSVCWKPRQKLDHFGDRIQTFFHSFIAIRGCHLFVFADFFLILLLLSLLCTIAFCFGSARTRLLVDDSLSIELIVGVYSDLAMLLFGGFSTDSHTPSHKGPFFTFLLMFGMICVFKLLFVFVCKSED